MENKAKVLLAEDDENLGMLLKEYLNAKGYQTDLFVDGEKAFDGFKNSKYDIVILDVMMPVKDGFSVAKDVRMIDDKVPILFLTAKSMKEDVLGGFSVGADDYMTKPFSIEELQYRIEAILRRTKGAGGVASQDQFTLGDYSFDATKQILAYKGVDQKLTAKESELLKFLCINRNAVLDRNFALKTIWSDDSYFNARSMDVYITKLRKYLKEDSSIQILNIRGKGFKLIG